MSRMRLCIRRRGAWRVLVMSVVVVSGSRPDGVCGGRGGGVGVGVGVDSIRLVEITDGGEVGPGRARSEDVWRGGLFPWEWKGTRVLFHSMGVVGGNKATYRRWAGFMTQWMREARGRKGKMRRRRPVSVRQSLSGVGGEAERRSAMRSVAVCERETESGAKEREKRRRGVRVEPDGNPGEIGDRSTGQTEKIEDREDRQPMTFRKMTIRWRYGVPRGWKSSSSDRSVPSFPRGGNPVAKPRVAQINSPFHFVSVQGYRV